MLLVSTDHLDKWSEIVAGIDSHRRRDVFAAAEPLWVERMVKDGKLLIHPDVVEDLSKAKWRPNDLQLKMIWASVLASIDGSDSKERFGAVKEKLVKKYGNKWWFDVYKRVKPAYAARMKLSELRGPANSAVGLLATRSSYVGLALYEELQRALQKIPRT